MRATNREATTEVVAHAPAKVNLLLEVLARRADGYHEIETLMATIALYDTLVFAPTDSPDIELQTRWAGGWAARALHTSPNASPALGDVPDGAKNIVHRAVDMLRRHTGITAGAHIQLIKRIPSAAGLGGASSDAAAALLAANMAWQLGWKMEQLRELAAQIGSDVPFFLADAGTSAAAICRGRGERIEPVTGGRLHLVVVRPPVGLSTPQVYARCRPATEPANAGNLAKAVASGNLAKIGKGLHNRLQAPAAELTPWIDRLERRFQRQHLAGHQMSGSGSSYFGIARSARHARRIAARLRGQRLGTVYRAPTIARM